MGEVTKIDISKNNLYSAGCEAVAAALDGNKVVTELNIASNSMGWIDGNHKATSGVVAIANAIKNMRALTVLNLANNQLGELVLPEGWSAKDEGSSWQKFVHADGREQREHPGKPEGIIAVADAIKDMGALSKLIMRQNNIHGTEAGRVFADMLAQSTVLKELDLSSQKVGLFHQALDADFAKEFAVGISGNGALACADGKYYHEWQLNPDYKSAEEVIISNKEQMLASLKELEQMEDGEEKRGALQLLGVTSVPTEEQLITLMTPLIDAQRIQAGLFKFKSTAPYIKGQDEDPGVPLANGICQHCGQPKGHHNAKGALSKLDASNNAMFGYQDKSGITAWADALKVSSSLTELNLAKNSMHGDDVKIFIGGLHDNRALLCLDISSSALASIRAIQKSKVPTWSIGDDVEYRGEKGKAVYWKGNPVDYIGFQNLSGIIAIANAIQDMGVLSKLLLKDNKLLTAEAGKILSDIVAANTVLKELDLSSNNWSNDDVHGGAVKAMRRQMHGDHDDESREGDGPGFAQAFSVGLCDNGTLSSLNLASNSICGKSGWMTPPRKDLKVGDLVDGNPVVRISANDSGRIKIQHISGGIALANAIRANVALTSANLLENDIGADQARALTTILKEHPTLKSLCGTMGNETELDMSGKMRGAGDAIMLVAEVIDNRVLSTLIFGGAGTNRSIHSVPYEPAALHVGLAKADFSNKNLGEGGAIIVSAWITHKDNGAMTKLDMSRNNIATKEAGKAIGEALKGNTVLRELDVSGYGEFTGIDPPGFAEEISKGLADNRALTKLNLSSNFLASKEAGHALGEMLKVNSVLTELDVSSNHNRYSKGARDSPGFVSGLADGIKANGTLLVLNLASNELGTIVGWTHHPDLLAEHRYKHSDGRHQEQLPDGDELGKPQGVIDLAKAIQDMGAVLRLDISANNLKGYGVHIICNALVRLVCRIPTL
jgi:Ran GTPase-activating protein (RanGAP) involved in mRNA processing and transport